MAQSPAPGTNPEPGSGAATDKADTSKADKLVEEIVAARAQYQLALERLRLHYLKVNDQKRAEWAEEELKAFIQTRKQSFNLQIGDVPPPNLVPAFNVPEANKLYREALKYKDQGYRSAYIANQCTAEQMFQQLLTLYPRCDKIGEAAYQLAEIYESTAFRQYERSAAYYERSFQWNKTTQSDARLRAARLYDKVLRNQPKAVRLYKEVIDHDTNDTRVKEAELRLEQIK